jgi:hypothetical protein
MGLKKFMKSVQSTLGLKNLKEESKKKSLKVLLKKLNSRKKSITALLKTPRDKKEENELKEELEIITLQIKKGKKILYKLYSKK